MTWTEWLEKFVESTMECTRETDTDKQRQLEDNGFETFMVCAFLQNNDSDKCGSLKIFFRCNVH